MFHVWTLQVESHIPLPLSFVLTNVGKTAFHYRWQWDYHAQISLTATNMSGMVGPQARVALTLQLTILTRTEFASIKLELAVSYMLKGQIKLTSFPYAKEKVFWWSQFFCCIPQVHLKIYL